jgi:hypothetical protein
MNKSKDFLNQIRSTLPELASTKDLINVGIFSSISHATHCRKRGDSPAFITLSKKRIMYPKEEVITWLQMRTTSRGEYHEE